MGLSVAGRAVLTRRRVVFRYRENVRWYHFWNPWSGPIGGGIAGIVLYAMVMLFMLLLASVAGASEWEPTIEEVLFQGVHAYDMQQTLDIKHHNYMHEGENFLDGGWAIGTHPKDSRIYAYFGAEAAVHLAVTSVLVRYGPRWSWRVWEFVTIGADGAIVRHNYQLGLRAHF